MMLSATGRARIEIAISMRRLNATDVSWALCATDSVSESDSIFNHLSVSRKHHIPTLTMDIYLHVISTEKAASLPWRITVLERTQRWRRCIVAEVQYKLVQRLVRCFCDR